MYNQQEIAEKIKQKVKENKTTLKQLLDCCDLNINYISDFAKGKDMTVNKLYEIANYLNVSIDYLLGRTEEPTQIMNNSGVFTGGIQAQNYNASAPQITGIESEVLNEMKKMNNKEKAQLLLKACEMTEKEN